MTLSERIDLLEDICTDLSETSSLNDKRAIVSNIPTDLKDDFQFVLEVLANKYPLGYTYIPSILFKPLTDKEEQLTFKEYIEPLWRPIKDHDLSKQNTDYWSTKCHYGQWFILPVVNKTLRLGIGLSLLPKGDTSPMLAKKWDGNLGKDTIYITEKLDGNRCIAYYDGTEWVYFSRNGKRKNNYNFDMSGLPKEYIYDGEVLTKEQTCDSIQLSNYIFGNTKIKPCYTKMFSQASGKMNRKDTQTNLVYNIFDIININKPYYDRRYELNTIEYTFRSDNVRILPVLYQGDSITMVDKLCDIVTNCGAEGLMINKSHGYYEHKRSNSLLKYKKSKTMDMKVYNIVEGNGKYEYAVGALDCEAMLPNGDKIICQVGTGLSDEQRFHWYTCKQDIIGKIVEIEYFDISQRENNRGTNIYSLRFPRLKQVRTDKNEMSIY